MSRNFNSLPVTIYDDLKPYELTPEQLLVYLYLLTCRASNSIGAFIEHPETISYFTGLSFHDVNNILDSLELYSLIKRFPGNWIVTYHRWLIEPSKSEKNIKGAFGEYRKLPPNVQKFFSFIHPDLIVRFHSLSLQESNISSLQFIAAQFSSDDSPEPEKFNYNLYEPFST